MKNIGSYLVAAVVFALCLGGIAGASSLAGEDATLLQSWQTMQTSQEYTKWKQQNSSQNTALVNYWNNGGTAPTLSSAFGRALVLEAQAYWSIKGTPPPDTTAPSAPGNFRTTSVAETSIALAWNASTDNVGVTGYNLYQGSTQIAQPTGLSATASSLTCGTSYTFGVEAKDAAGNISTRSTLNASTSACPPPSGWTFCANEHELCSFSGTKEVRYGINSTYFTRTATGSIMCDNATFGDPAPGLDKHCDYRDVTAPPPTGTLKYRPPGWNGGDPTLASSFPGYTVINATNSTETLNLNDSTDYYINMGTKSWSSISSGRSIGLAIQGGRNVVLVGGTFTQTKTNNLDDSTAILVSDGNPAGIVHLEGLSTDSVNGITIRTKRKVQIQNSRISVSTWNDDSEGGNGLHPDIVQVWGTQVTSHAPSAGIYMHNVTAFTTYTGLSNLLEVSPTSCGGCQTNPIVWERWNVDIHPKQNNNGTFDAGNYFYHSDSPTGCNGGPYTDFIGEVYSELPTGGGGAYTRGIDDISVLRGFCNPTLNFPYEIRTPDGTAVFTSSISPTGGSGLASAKMSGNYLTMSRVPDYVNQKLFVGQPPTSKGAVAEGSDFVFVPSNIPGPNYVSPLYE